MLLYIYIYINIYIYIYIYISVCLFVTSSLLNDLFDRKKRIIPSKHDGATHFSYKESVFAICCIENV